MGSKKGKTAGKHRVLLAVVIAVVLMAVLYFFGAGEEVKDNVLVVGSVKLDGSIIKKSIDNDTNITTVKTFILRGSGSSMYPLLKPEEFYLCVEQYDYEIGDVVTYQGSLSFVPYPSQQEIEQGYKITGHRITGKSPTHFWIKGDNSFAVDVVARDKVFCKIVV